MKSKYFALRLIGMFGLVFIPTAFTEEVKPEDIIKAIDEMTPEQAYEVQEKLAAKVWEPIPENFFARMSFGLDISYENLEDVNLSSLRLSSGDLDIDDLSGSDFTLLWQVIDPRLRFGFRFGAGYAEDSSLTDAGYSSAELYQYYSALVVNAQLIRSAHWLVWTDVAAGGGSLDLDVVDTPSGSSTLLRKFDDTYGLLDLKAGVSLRCNPILSIFLSGGYRLADDADLEEGDRSTNLTIEPGGFNAQLGLGLNF